LVEDFKPRKKIKSKKKTWGYVNSLLRLSIWLSIAISLVLVSICAIAYISTSKVFLVKSIGIEGASHVKRDQVISMLDLDKGDNIFSWNMKLAKDRLESYPWIKSVSISRRFIPASVTVRIKEYKPEACAIIDGKRYLVSKEGKVFALAPKSFTGLTIEGINNLPVESRASFLKTLANSVQIIEKHGYTVKTVDLGPGMRTTISLEGKISLVLWDEIDMSKIKRAFVVMKRLGAREGVSLDLGYDNKIVLRSSGKGA